LVQTRRAILNLMGISPKLVASSLILMGTAALVGSACHGSQAESKPQLESTVSSMAPVYTTTATIKDIMKSIVDPSADVVWNSVQSTVTEKGVQDHQPRTDEEWDEARAGAIRLMEATNLLIIPGRHVARPGEKSDAPGSELEPAEMEVLINKDRPAWEKRARALHDAAEETLQAIEKHDAETVFALGERIEHACESCHLQYWYPNQKLPPGYDRP
jgi:hypothetical protein